MRRTIFSLLCLLALSGGRAVAGDAALPKHYTPAVLEDLFRAGTATPIPAGKYAGKVVWVDEALMPRVRGKMQGVVWKGKHFGDDGNFTNRFPGGFEALPSSGRMEASWVDGQPAYVLDYPPDYPLFGKNRDEMRQIADGVWLGRVWKRGCEPKVASWFLLTLQCGK